MRSGHFKNKLQHNLLLRLQAILSKHIPYVQLFRSAGAILDHQPNSTIVLKSLPPGRREKKTYNKPRPEDVGAIIQCDGDLDPSSRHVIIQNIKDGSLQPISDLNTFYFGVRYPCLLWFGSHLWDDQYISPSQRTNAKRESPFKVSYIITMTEVLYGTGLRKDYKVTQLEWLAWMLYERNGQFSPFVNSRRLTQQFCVDAYPTVERSRIRWVRMNQDAIKADLYQGLRDSVESNQSIHGRKVILPSSFSGSPRQMTQLYHDAIALVREYGYPSLFITMTANPTWPEINACLVYGQTASDRPDIVSRVFKMKLDKMMKDLIDRGRLGKVVSYLVVDEFQKRGLPHVHILLIVDEASRPKTSDSIDNLVCAVIPDPVTEPTLYSLVTKNMLHGPCKKGFSCWEGGRCTLRFPKPFADCTTLSDGSYPSYRRPDDGVIVKKGSATFTNGHVVPYNPFLLLKYACHINVEIPVGSKPIKYLYKYLTKGHDMTRVEMIEKDSIDIAQEDALPRNQTNPHPRELQETRAEKEARDETLRFTTYRFISAIESESEIPHLPGVLLMNQFRLS